MANSSTASGPPTRQTAVPLQGGEPITVVGGRAGPDTPMSERFDELVRLMATLRAPDGCPWDRKQTHESLKPYLLEEAYEVLETIDRGDVDHLREELGDLLLQVLFHAQIGTESRRFTIEDVMQHLTEKLVRRHPHVFGDAEDKAGAANADQVLSRWEDIKKAERKQHGRAESVLDGVPKTLPALLRAYQIQARASRVGFDWPNAEPVLGKIQEELGELHEALHHGEASPSSAGSASAHVDGEPRTRIEEEFGDVLFSLVNLARFLKINPEEALRRATNRFTERFHYLEARAREAGRTLADMSLEEMDALWEAAKQQPSSVPDKPHPPHPPHHH